MENEDGERSSSDRVKERKRERETNQEEARRGTLDAFSDLHGLRRPGDLVQAGFRLSKSLSIVLMRRRELNRDTMSLLAPVFMAPPSALAHAPHG